MIAPSFAFNLFHPMEIRNLIRNRHIGIKIDASLRWEFDPGDIMDSALAFIILIQVQYGNEEEEDILTGFHIPAFGD